MRVEDAVVAARAGADAVGMIFYKPAPRCISLELARAIVTALPPYVEPVGVFVDAPANEVIGVAADVGLRTVQLNGHETPELIRDLGALEVVKAIRVDAASIEDELNNWRKAIATLRLENLGGFVLEPARTGQAGGSGVANDWNTIEKLQRDGLFHELPPLVAAGGLAPETVAEVVARIRPWAVDVSSGVEESRGVKSKEKIQRFVGAVQLADRQRE
jgi:phosphoribosylanthranilate isomerase